MQTRDSVWQKKKGGGGIEVDADIRNKRDFKWYLTKKPYIRDEKDKD